MFKNRNNYQDWLKINREMYNISLYPNEVYKDWENWGEWLGTGFVASQLRKFYGYKELKRMLPELIEYWEKKIGVKVDFCGIKQMKTKWGSCGIAKKRIWLNLELAKKPIHCLEYILVHEMIHLLERNHTDKFKAHMNYYLPNWKKLRDELNRLPVSHADWSY